MAELGFAREQNGDASRQSERERGDWKWKTAGHEEAYLYHEFGSSDRNRIRMIKY